MEKENIPLIRVENLKKYYPVKGGIITHTTGYVKAVDGVSFSVMRGQTLGLVGESGCGKSTIGRQLVGLETPTEGKIYYDGVDLSALQKDRKQMREVRTKLQMIFQDPYSSIDPRMTVSETIKEALMLTRRYTRPEVEERTKELMNTVGLSQRLWTAYPHELDGGRRQRIGIARALSVSPAFIVCDEPVSALDVSIQAQILNLMQDLQESQGLSYAFITHDLSVVRHISDEICVMYMGEIVEKAPAKELFRSPVHPYTKALLASIPIPDVHHKRNEEQILQGEVTSPIEPKLGCRFASRCRFASEECLEKQTLCEVTKRHYVMCCKQKTLIGNC